MDRRKFLTAAGAATAAIAVPALTVHGAEGATAPKGKKTPRPTPTWTPTPTPTATSTPTPGGIQNLPAQPASVMYGDPIESALIDDYAHPGGMVVAGRSSYNDSALSTVSAAGGHVMIYLDCIVWNDFGRYHNLLFNASTISGTSYSAVPKWPGPVNANSTGDLADFRTTSVMHTEGKLEAVVRLMASENPHMSGFFMDDVGSRSWFPNFNWDTFGSTNQTNYRDGAIQVCQTLRNVCNDLGLWFMVNGTWTGLDGLTFAQRGGGYPNIEVNGNALAEGGCVEHHDGEASFWGPYMGDATSQWGDSSPLTNGKPFCLVIATGSSGTTEYRTDGRAAWVTAAQPTSAYGGVAPWGTVSDFHPTGLPSHT